MWGGFEEKNCFSIDKLKMTRKTMVKLLVKKFVRELDGSALGRLKNIALKTTKLINIASNLDFFKCRTGSEFLQTGFIQ